MTRRRYHKWPPPSQPRINFWGMLWWTFWFVVVFSLLAAAVASALDLMIG